MSAENPVQLTRRLYGDPYEDGDREFLLDADLAANEVAALVSAITGDEVDGDGSPWEIALDHLMGVADAIATARRLFPELDAWLRDEWAYGDPLWPPAPEAAA